MPIAVLDLEARSEAAGKSAGFPARDVRVSMKSVLLVEPPPVDWGSSPTGQSVTVPLGLLIVATCLRAAGVTVIVVDGRLDPAFRERVLELVRQDTLLYVGFSVMTGQVREALRLAREVKALRPRLPVVFGGVHATLFPEQTARDPHVDIVVVGDGEDTSVELAHALSGDVLLDSVRGIAYRREGEVFMTSPRPLRDLDSLPNLNYDLVPVKAYMRHDWSRVEGQPRSVRTLGVLTGRGCSHRCTFCLNITSGRRRHDARSASRVVDEIAELQDRYKITKVGFVDPDFFHSRNRVLEFLDGVSRRNLRFTWVGNARAEYFTDGYLGPDRVAQLREAGCSVVAIGAESGSQRVLDYLRKDIRVEDILRSAEMTGRARMPAAYYFMMGIPGETKAEMNETLRLALRLIELNRQATIIGPKMYRPYPGAPLFEACVRSGLRVPESLSEWAELADVDGCVGGGDRPWASDRRFFASLEFALGYALRRRQRPGVRGVTGALVTAASRFRIRTGWWSCHLERAAHDFLRGSSSRVQGPRGMHSKAGG